MSDEENNDSAERMRMDEDAFNRLPLSVQLATKLQHERKQATIQAHVDRSAKRAATGASAGVTIFLMGYAGIVNSTVFLIFVGAAGGLAGFLAIRRRWNNLISMLVFCAVAIVCGLAGAANGCISEILFMLIAWISIAFAGFLLANWAESNRTKDGGF